jgi:hypothetical protein
MRILIPIVGCFLLLTLCASAQQAGASSTPQARPHLPRPRSCSVSLT